MAFDPISSDSIEVGDAIKKELLDKIKGNLDDHEDRINSIEEGARRVQVFKHIVLNAASSNTFTGLNYFIAEEDFTLTSAVITIFEKGSLTGALEVDIKKSTTDLDSPSFSSVFTTKPKITLATASNYSSSTNQVFDNNKTSINSGDKLRLDITEMPSSGVLGKFILSVYGEKS